MRTVNEKARRHKEIEIMETCFDCYAENGFTSVGVKAIAKACGCSGASLYQYFGNFDDLIVKSTEYCIGKVEDEFMAKAPTDVADLWRFIALNSLLRNTTRKKNKVLLQNKSNSKISFRRKTE